MMEHILYGFLIIFLTFAFIFGLMVVMVKLISQKSLADSLDIVGNWGEKFFEWLEKNTQKQQVQILFPVFIGANGYTVRDEFVNEAFEQLGKYWEIFFYTVTYQYSTNVIIYEFKVYNPLSVNLDNRRLRMRAKEVAESALTKHMHNHGFYGFVIDNFVYVSLKADTLRIHIATNPMGFSEIAELRKSNP